MAKKHLITPYIIAKEIAFMRGDSVCPVVELEYRVSTDALDLKVEGKTVAIVDELTLADSLDNFSKRVLYPLFGHVLTNPSWTYRGP